MLRDAATPPTSQWHTCNGVSALVAYLHSWTAHTSGLSGVLGGGKWAPVGACGCLGGRTHTGLSLEDPHCSLPYCYKISCPFLHCFSPVIVLQIEAFLMRITPIHEQFDAER